MRIEATLAGTAVVWENGRKTRLRVEIALDMPWSEIARHIGRSETIQSQAIYSGFSYPDGRPIPEDEVDALAAKDQDAFKALMLTIRDGAASETPLAPAPSPQNSGNGAPSVSTPPASGNSKTGKSRKSPPAARNT